MNRVERLIASPMGAIVARPWFDRFTIRFFERWFFPSSRLWAAARAANGSVDEFFEQVPIHPLPRLSGRIASLLQRFEQVRGKVLVAEADWENAFFGQQEVSPLLCAEAEQKRLNRRAEYNELRRRFTFLTRHAKIPPVRWELSSPMELAADYAKVIRSEQSPFAVPDEMPAVPALWFRAILDD